MKLELKHLTSYLPYDVSIKRHGYFYSGNGLDDIKYGAKTGVLKASNIHYAIETCKLILRPISDLTKEIEIDGKKIIPIVELARMFYTHVFDYIKVKSYDNILDANGMITLDCYEEDCEFSCGSYRVYTGSCIDRNEYRVIKKLIEWHFDVYGLIDAGLAIDVNTI